MKFNFMRLRLFTFHFQLSLRAESNLHYGRGMRALVRASAFLRTEIRLTINCVSTMERQAQAAVSPVDATKFHYRITIETMSSPETAQPICLPIEIVKYRSPRCATPSHICGLSRPRAGNFPGKRRKEFDETISFIYCCAFDVY